MYTRSPPAPAFSKTSDEIEGHTSDQYRYQGLSNPHVRRSSPATRFRHQCLWCEKSYERPDHLIRHVRSHENIRQYRCGTCNKGFNRLDLLNRHALCHSRDTTQNRARTLDRSKQKTTQACRECVKAKTRCTDGETCERCRKRNTVCIRPNPPAAKPDSSRGCCVQSTGSKTHTIESQSIKSPPESNLTVLSADSDRNFERIIGDTANIVALDADIASGTVETSVERERIAEYQSQPLPLFFDHIMMPQADGTAHQDVVAPPDVSNFVQDFHFSFNDLDFQLLESLAADFFPPSHSALKVSEANPAPAQSILALRADAFQQSQWEWSPSKDNDYSASQQKYISINEGVATQSLALPLSRHTQYLPHQLSISARDELFKAVLNTCSARQNITSFPSQALLTNVIEVFHITEADSLETRVQPHLFSSTQARPELLLALIAAGSVATDSDPLQKMGMAFQEVVRLSVAELFERENTTARDLQALQAFLLCIDIGMWSGYKRSMEIAGGFLQPAYTLLLKANAFARSNHLAVDIVTAPTAELIESLWQDWLKMESMKRLAIQAFLHDSRASLALLRNPVISYTRMSIPLPSSRDLWLAPNSMVWGQILMTGTASVLARPPLLVEVFANVDVLEHMESKVDVYLSFLAALHATAAQVWEHKQQTALAKIGCHTPDQDAELLNDAFRKHLSKKLIKLRSKCETYGQKSPEAILLTEFLLMSLDVSLHDVQLFAGKEGESGARDVLPTLREWCQSKGSRKAVWHAGQVLRAARDFRQNSLRGFHVVVVYFSALTLWVYGLITFDSHRQSELASTESVSVFLDGDDCPSTKSFIIFNQGSPFLHHKKSGHDQNGRIEAQGCSLTHAKGVMMVAAAIIQDNFAPETSCLPTIVANLLDLIKKLGEFSDKDSDHTG